MDLQEWSTISRLLDEALELPAVDRRAWIDRLPAPYESLKPRLIAMLSQTQSDEGDGFLAALPPLDLTALAGEEGISLRAGAAGAAVGPYRLQREIASGGQGSVWLAERTDGLINRPVALKLPIGLSFRPQLAERMAREREILASLEHPHIARLYDAGITGDGVPYLALEFVDGASIDRYCDTHGLAIAARVRLFIQVIRAVAYAHGRLVIHRDLKPSNVLVAADGDVRLLDFGIAKLLDEGRSPVESTLTEAGGRAMTLHYASPEQVGRQPLGVATDIYSLGVMLYELVAGARPYRPARDTVAALEEAILTADPIRPSDHAAGAAARRALRGDLDTILLKSLKKRPDERYATAAELGDDLQRYLDGRPVAAQPDRLWYRARKFTSRHRVGVAGTAAAAAALIAGAGVALWQAQVARAERDAARVQEARAVASNDFLQSLLQQAGTDRPLTVTELLAKGATQLDQAPDLDPAVRAYLQYQISTHYLRFNQTEREVELLTKAAAGARAVGDFDLLASAECSAAWSLGYRDTAGAAARLASGEQAMSALRPPSFKVVTDCLRGRSRLLEAQGDVAGAIRLIEERLPQLPPPSRDTWLRLSLLQSLLSDYYRRVDRYKDALRISEELHAEGLRRGQAGSFNDLVGRNNIAGNLARLGEVAAAHAIYRELLAWYERGDLPVPPVGIQGNVGFSEMRMGNFTEALRLAERERVVDETAGNPVQGALADLLASRALLALDRRTQSRERLEAAEAFFRKNPQLYARQLTETSVHRAELLAAEGRVTEALSAVDEVLASLGYPHRQTAPALDRVLRASARLRIQAGDHARALDQASVALAFSRRLARDERKSGDVGDAALIRAQVLAALERPAEALADARLAVDALRAGFGADHPTTRIAVDLLSTLSPSSPGSR
jgi:serine/threonine-protein kinase